MIKVFTTNEKGLIEFTPEALETLLKEVEEEGYCNGKEHSFITYPSGVKSIDTYPTVTYYGEKGVK